MDFELINWKLLSHPVNWGIVWTVLLLVMLAYTQVHNNLIAQAKSAANQSVIPD